MRYCRYFVGKLPVSLEIKTGFVIVFEKKVVLSLLVI